MGLMDRLKSKKSEETETPKVLSQRVREITDDVSEQNAPVNPPPPVIPEGHMQCEFCLEIFPVTAIQEHWRNCEKNPQRALPEKAAAKEGGVNCPKCGKGPFKYLGKHKCKISDEEVQVDSELHEKNKVILEKTSTNELSDNIESLISGEAPAATVEGAKEVKTDNNIIPNFTLLIDCVVDKIDPERVFRLGELIEDVAKQIENEFDVVHWCSINFAKGPPLLAAMLDDTLTHTALPGGAYILAESTSMEYRACQEVLKKHAQFVFRGIR